MEVLVFGQLTDVTKKAQLTLPALTNTDLLREKLLQDYPGLKEFTFVIAVNKQTVQGLKDLQDTDVVALMPAFSGG